MTSITSILLSLRGAVARVMARSAAPWRRRPRLSRGGLTVLLLATLIGGFTLNPRLARADTSTTTVQSCYSLGQQYPASTCQSYNFSDTGKSAVPVFDPVGDGYFYACYLNGQTDPSCTVAMANISIGDLWIPPYYACFVNGQPSASCTLFWGMSANCISDGVPDVGACGSLTGYTPTGKAFVQGPDGTYYVCEVNGEAGGCAIEDTSDFSVITCYLPGGLPSVGCDVVTSPTAPSVPLPAAADLLNQAALSASMAPPFIGSSLIPGDTPAQDGLYHATPAERQALQDLEQEAVADTAADHGLSSSDALAAQTWGRDDALAELWGLFTQAINTSPSDRTTDQQGAVDWLAQVVQREGVAEAFYAGLEYTKWAGLDQNTYEADAEAYLNDQAAGNDTSAAKSALEGFLNQVPQSYAVPQSGTTWTSSTNLQTLQDTATEGYCVYQSPSPDQTQYQGNIFSGPAPSQCFEPGGGLGCLFDCAPNAPAASSFVQWGDDDANYTLLNNPDFSTAFRDVALGVGLGGVTANVANALALRGALNAIWEPVANGGATSGGATGSSISSVVSQATKVDLARVVAADTRAFDAGAEAAEALVSSIAELADVGAAAASASGVGAIAAGVIFFVTTATVAIMNFVNNQQVPQQLAQGIEGAPTQTVDLQSMLADNNDVGELYSLFLLATEPAPAVNCNSIPPPSFTNHITFGQTCLNPPPPAAQDLNDPLFMVSENGGTASPQNTITWYDQSSGNTATARLHENWFVEQVTDSNGTPYETKDNDGVARQQIQALRILYTDWNGNEQEAWLENVPNAGYRFIAINLNALQGTVLNPTTCSTDNTCTYTDSIDYVDSSGNKYSATVVPYQAPTVTTSAGPNPVEGTAQSFSASATAPLGHTITYQWQFEQPQASGSGGGYTSPISGANVSYTWPTSGTFHVQLTVTDSFGSFERTQVSTFTVTVGDVPPTVTLKPDCATLPMFIWIPCDWRTTTQGSATTLTGAITHAGSADTETVTVDWGDGTSDIDSTGDNATGPAGFTLKPVSDTTITLSDTHTYASRGLYNVTVTVKDQSGATVKATAAEVVQGTQTIAFGPIPAHNYGDAPFSIGATGGASGKPVTFTVTTPTVCSISSLGIGTDTNGGASYSAMVTLLSAGTCTIAANQAGSDDSVYLPADQVEQSFQVNPVPLTITANDKSMTYGGSMPSFDASYSGFVNGDTAASLTTPPTCSPSVTSGSGVGSYPITCSGAVDANYTISYTAGTLTVAAAPLTITANNQSMTYGGSVPAFTASYRGLVGGDTSSAVSGLTCTATDGSGNPVSSGTPAGSYAITCSGGTAANYTISYQPGTLTVAAAPLTITADNQSTVYGQALPPFTVTPKGLVNGDTLAALQGTLKVATTATQTSAPGTYTLTPSGLSSPNYSITFDPGTLTIGKDASTVTLASSASSALFGQPVTLSAKVSAAAPGSGTPTGTVTFLDGGTAIGTAALANGQASLTTATLLGGTHSLSVSYGGDANFTAGTSATFSQAITFSSTISGTANGPQTVHAGQTVLISGAVNGPLTVQAGGAVALMGAHLNGPLKASGAGAVVLCGSTVGGPLSISGSTGFVRLGAGSDDPGISCAADTIQGPLTLSGNTGGIEVEGAAISGPLSLTNNVGTATGGDSAAPELEGNTIGGPLSCSGNSPAPTADGHPNTVNGPKSGQCTGM